MGFSGLFVYFSEYNHNIISESEHASRLLSACEQQFLADDLVFSDFLIRTLDAANSGRGYDNSVRNLERARDIAARTARGFYNGAKAKAF